jgi:hypothetical protein
MEVLKRETLVFLGGKYQQGDGKHRCQLAEFLVSWKLIRGSNRASSAWPEPVPHTLTPFSPSMRTGCMEGAWASGEPSGGSWALELPLPFLQSSVRRKYCPSSQPCASPLFRPGRLPTNARSHRYHAAADGTMHSHGYITLLPTPRVALLHAAYEQSSSSTGAFNRHRV